MAEQKKHAKGGTGKKVFIFLVKVQQKKRRKRKLRHIIQGET